MLLAILSLWNGPVGTWGIADFLCALVLIAAAIGIAIIALNYFGVSVPPPIIRIIWIVVVAAVAIVAIRFLAGL